MGFEKNAAREEGWIWDGSGWAGRMWREGGLPDVEIDVGVGGVALCDGGGLGEGGELWRRRRRSWREGEGEFSFVRMDRHGGSGGGGDGKRGW